MKSLNKILTINEAEIIGTRSYNYWKLVEVPNKINLKFESTINKLSNA